MEKVSLCSYGFSASAPGEYIYRLQMLEDWPSSAKGQEYIRLVEETGAQQVGSLIWWVYFRRKAALGPFELFSDVASRLRHYHGIAFLLAMLLVPNAIIFWMNIGSAKVPWTTQVFQAVVMLALGWGLCKLWQKISHLKKEGAVRE